jgi:Uma2 family endonuclease
MSIATVPAEQRVCLSHVPWSVYVSLSDGSRTRHALMSFDNGLLEIMSPGVRHEEAKHLISRMIETWAEVREIDIRGVASATFRREDVQQGFEGDEAYYVANACKVRGLEEIDLLIHPAPDLVIEIDISGRSTRKFAIYESLGVPEVWIFDGQSVAVYVADSSRRLVEVTDSVGLQGFPLHRIGSVIQQAHEQGETAAIREFRKSIIPSSAEQS